LDLLTRECASEGLRICKKTGRGIWLEQVAKSVPLLNSAESVLWGRTERCQAVVTELLDKDICSIDALAEQLSISRNTLLQDLKTVQDMLNKRNLTYHSKRGQGIWAGGTEQSIRDMLIHIFSSILYNFTDIEKYKKSVCVEYLFGQYTTNIPVPEIANVFLGLMKEQNFLENDMSINRMICSLLIQYKRLVQKKCIDNAQPVYFISDEGERLKELSARLAKALSHLHPDFLLETEKQYIMKELLHSRIYLFAEGGIANKDENLNLAALALARKFVEYAQVWLGDIYMEDEELIYNLAMHLQPSIERAQAGIELTNSLLPEIRKQYSGLFMIAKKAAEKIFLQTKIKLSEDEIGYLTIHLGGAVERRKIRKSKKLSVLLVCGNGVGTANLLAITLKNRMPHIDIVKIVSLYKLQANDITDIDIVISTVALDLQGTAVLRVSPILTETEIKVIDNQMQYFYDKKFAGTLLAAAQTVPLRLKDVLSEDMISLNQKAVDWQSSVRLAGHILEAAGAATEGYTEQMVACIDKLGPYTIVCPGVAMPHARVDDGARKVAVSFLRLKKGVTFSAEHKAVDMIFAFSTVDEKSHLQIMSDLWELFTNEQIMKCLRQAETKQEILQIIQQVSG
jgi:mannitol operon transcriptional antiterminator